MVSDISNHNVMLLIGLSTDTKPLKADIPFIKNGSEFKEVDTSKYFIYDELTDAWIQSDVTSVPIAF